MINEMDEKISLISEYIDEEECGYMCDDNLFDCASCSFFEKCYTLSCERCDDDLGCSNDDFDGFAETINYGGYKNAEEFWNEILE